MQNLKNRIKIERKSAVKEKDLRVTKIKNDGSACDAVPKVSDYACPCVIMHHMFGSVSCSCSIRTAEHTTETFAIRTAQFK